MMIVFTFCFGFCRSFLCLFLYFGAFIAVISADCSGSSTCSIRDHVTTKRIYRTFTANDFASCILECYNDAKCSSYNYEYQPKHSSGHICQLSKCWTNESLVGKQKFWFQQLKPSLNEDLCNGLEDRKAIGSSVILQRDPRYLQTLLDFLGPMYRTWKRCYHSAGMYAFNVTVFHRGCDSKGPTVTVVRVDKYVFGGYFDKSWESLHGSDCKYVESNKTFLFFFNDASGFNPRKYPVKKPALAAYSCKDKGPAFGAGAFDLIIKAGNIASQSIPLCYDIPQLCSIIGNKDCIVKKLVDGTKVSFFNPHEIEIFYGTI